jgi:hypothetical protein
MVVMSLGLTHSHFLAVAIVFGQDKAAARAEADAALHLLLPIFHAHDVHLSHIPLVDALVLHLFSI